MTTKVPSSSTDAVRIREFLFLLFKLHTQNQSSSASCFMHFFLANEPEVSAFELNWLFSICYRWFFLKRCQTIYYII